MFRSNIICVLALLEWTVKNTDEILIVHPVQFLEFSAFNRAFYNERQQARAAVIQDGEWWMLLFCVYRVSGATVYQQIDVSSLDAWRVSSKQSYRIPAAVQQPYDMYVCLVWGGRPYEYQYRSHSHSPWAICGAAVSMATCLTCILRHDAADIFRTMRACDRRPSRSPAAPPCKSQNSW